MERDTYASAHSVSGSTRADCKFPPCGMLRFSLLKRRTLAEILVRNFTPSRKFEKTPWGVAGERGYRSRYSDARVGEFSPIAQWNGKS